MAQRYWHTPTSSFNAPGGASGNAGPPVADDGLVAEDIAYEDLKLLPPPGIDLKAVAKALASMCRKLNVFIKPLRWVNMMIVHVGNWPLHR